MKRLKIYSFPDKSPEYLQLQIDSYRKYMDDGNTDLIIINASSLNRDEIDNICEYNNIEVIQYEGDRNTVFANYYVNQLNWFRDKIQSNVSDYILLIHSDMFFIDSLDYKKLMSSKKLYFCPQYRNKMAGYFPPNGFDYFYMWDGTVLFDSEYFNSNGLTSGFIWDRIFGISDVGGETYKLLKKIDKSIFGYVEMWNVYNIDNNIFDTHLNGNLRISFNIDSNRLFLVDFNKYYDVKKSFEYENDIDDYESYYIKTFLNIKSKYIDGYSFPSPIHIDLISMFNDESNPFLLHFKSGSGYRNMGKLEEVKKIVNK